MRLKAKYYPTTLRFEMGLCCYYGLGNSLGIYGLNIAGNVRITAIKKLLG